MSNFEPHPSQPDWREQYSSFSLAGENGTTQPSFEHISSSTLPERPAAAERENDSRPLLEHRHSIAQLRQDAPSASIVDRPDSAPIEIQQSCGTVRDESQLLPDSSATSLSTKSVLSATSTPPQQGTLADEEGVARKIEPKDEEDEDDEDDDEDMLDADENATPQTAAERRAERRKMKRFRLTHQQTRFLMSEFAKQAHPDAAHRERLSKEIPGLSPRQVQVWFQNRRAKIKRLTADDRERMMKMRAVPDDFDTVQALHSPYGAVHGVGTPMHSPAEFVSTYTDHMMRPLMVDTMRRSENEDHMSPTGLSPAFGHVGFSNGGSSIGTPDILSPVSMSSSDRYCHSMSSPLSSGPRSAGPFERQSSSYQPPLSHSRQNVRPLQPLQLRETMSRSRSESLQSPLRSSMSWKGQTLDYANYQSGQPSPQLSGRQQSVYQPEQAGNSVVNAHPYDANTYSNSSISTSPAHMAYPSPHSSSMSQSSTSAISRLRAASSAFPPSLDLRAQQYRTISAQHSPHGMPSPARSNSFAGPYSGGYSSAPLNAPHDFSLPRTPSDVKEFNVPQLSAPMAPPQDFSSAYNSSLNSPRHPRIPTDRDFHTQQSQSADPPNQGPRQLGDPQQHQQARNNDSTYLRPDNYDDANKRSRNFTMPGLLETSP